MENQLQNQQTQRSITFKANGDDVTLSPSIVRDYLVRGNSKEVTRQEIAMFLNLCKFQHLNPFLNEAFIVKFGDKPAQLITSKEAFMILISLSAAGVRCTAKTGIFPSGLRFRLVNFPKVSQPGRPCRQR